jgi:hypothetical protein
MQKLRFPRLRRQTVTESCLLVTGIPALRRQELYTGFYPERERLPIVDEQKSFAGILSDGGRQFNKGSTVHTATNSGKAGRCNKGASDGIIVVKKCL